MRALASLVLLAGCSQILGLSNFQTATDGGGGGSDGGIADSAVDAPPIDAPTPYACSDLGSALAITGMIRELGSGELTLYTSFGSAACDLLGSGSALTLSGSNLFATSSTADPSPYIQHGSAQLPVDAVELAVDTAEGSNVLEAIVVSTFHLASGASLRSVGPDPLVILATGEITIDGVLDVSAGGTGTSGLAASPCHDGSGAQFAGETGDGGAGGGFQGSGGDGANGFNGSTTPAGPPTPVSDTLYFPYRGCQGGPGGNNGGAGSPPIALGGGAVYLVSETGISVSGAVNAGGQGGPIDNLSPLDGGGGGASGGTILLEAPVVNVSGVLAANGGGGASGVDNSEQGSNGASGTASSTRTPGGGSGAGGGGLGAASTFLNGAPGMPGAAESRGGGGGGGGAGFIIVHRGSALNTSTGPGTVSPPPTMLPM